MAYVTDCRVDMSNLIQVVVLCAVTPCSDVVRYVLEDFAASIFRVKMETAWCSTSLHCVITHKTTT
jgi:hypothetical protein